MEKLTEGKYFGKHYHKTQFNNLLISDTLYTHDKVDWHYHENPYFTYLLYGKLYEESKKKNYHLTSGSLLFHNWQDAHYNIKPPIPTRGFHIEIKKDWFDSLQINNQNFEGSIELKNSLIKENIHKIFFETKINDTYSRVSIEQLLVNSFELIHNKKYTSKSTIPIWVEKIKEILHYETFTFTSIKDLAILLNIHPVHLSREFPKYFKTTIGNYIRAQKINKALLLIIENKLSLTEISYECGFYDQSHFIRTFKKIYESSPLQFSKKIKDVNILQF